MMKLSRYKIHKKLDIHDKEIENNKTLVCGHWHTSDFYNNLEYKKEPEKWLDVYTDNPIILSVFL